MSIVAMSETVGSGGTEIGRVLATELGWEFADREIITKAAEAFGEPIMDLRHATEERPTLWDRFRQSQRRYLAYVEATILELAARDNVVLVGRASTIILGDVPHALRVRVIASERVRAERIERQQGLTAEGARELVRDADRDLASRVRFLYHLDWENPLLYDVVINTDRTSVARAVAVLREWLTDGRFAPTDASRGTVRDRSVLALAQAALRANPLTRTRALGVTVARGVVTLSGRVDDDAERNAAEAAVARIPGLISVRNGILVFPGSETASSHGQFRHGEERSWGGYGGGGYQPPREGADRPKDQRQP
jgi:cytidylate kinase